MPPVLPNLPPQLPSRRLAPQAEIHEADDFSKLTLLLRLVLQLNQESPAIPHYPGTSPVKLDEDHMLHLGVLDALSAILVQDHEVLALLFSKRRVTVVIENSDAITLEIPVEHQTAPGSKTLYPPKVVAITNPDFSANKILKPSTITHKLQVLDKGNNLWPLVSKYEWHFAMMGPRPFPDHAATVSAYLNAYTMLEYGFPRTCERARCT